MTIAERYLRYLEEIETGARPLPEGISLQKEAPIERAAELQMQIQAMGLGQFLRLCAAQDGQTLSDEEANVSPEELMQAMQAMEQPQEEESGAEPPKIDEPDGPRSAYEVLIDCCSLDEKLMYYLVDVLRRGAEEEFQKLALVTARKAFTQADFLYWFGTKEERADEEEFICVSLMDACLTRLASEGQVELIAALISGDQTTFELFRCEAPELRQLPQATFAWYEKNYLQRFYPLRYLLKHNGVKFLKEKEA